MKILNNLEVLQLVEAELAKVTDAQVTNAANRIGELKADAGEKPIGVCHSSEVRKLYVVTRKMVGRALELANSSASAESEEEEYKLSAESKRYSVAANLARDLMWAELHYTSDHKVESLGIRNGWMVVSRTSQADRKAAMRGILGKMGITLPEEED